MGDQFDNRDQNANTYDEDGKNDYSGEDNLLEDQEEQTDTSDDVLEEEEEEEEEGGDDDDDDDELEEHQEANAPVNYLTIDEADEDQEDDSEEYEEDEEPNETPSDRNQDRNLGNSNPLDRMILGNGNNAVNGSYVSDSFNFNNGEDLGFSCHNCQSTIKSEEYGKIECQICGAINYRYNLNQNILVAEFRTLNYNPDDNYQFKKLLSKISNAFIGKEYYRAYRLCSDASEIAPGESVVWELFAQAEYFARTRGQLRPKQGYTPHEEIINLVKIHIKRAKLHSPEKDYSGNEVVAGEIAEDITNNTRSKLGQFTRKRKKGTNEKMYSKVDLRECCKLLPQFKSAYKLTGNTFHLKAYIEELSKEYKWIIEKLDGTLVAMPNVPRKFKPVRERRYLIELIQQSEPDYQPPSILKERLSFDFGQIEVSPNEKSEIEGLIFHEEE